VSEVSSKLDALAYFFAPLLLEGRDALWRHPDHGLCGTEEGFSRREVAGVAEAHVHQVPVSINRPIEILPPTVNTQVVL
jgi:hypothetical protein